MPGQDLSRPLVGAGASASNEFANAEANAGIDFIGSAELKRGFKTDIGLTAFTNASAGISKFVTANIEGTAFASARAGIQGQLCLNLFKEFGFIVKAEAVAEAAAGVKASLGINIGDFINLALKDKNNLGLPVELLMMLIEEVEIGGSYYVDVSFSAKAHFTLSLSGTLLPKPGEKAGFKFTTKAGAGLAEGVGMAFKAGIGFKDFRRFYGRAVDRTVDEVINQINANLPQNAKAISPYISAFGPISKISLRLSYDIGEKIIKNNIGRSANDAQALCNECVKIILEEIQRFSIEKLAVYSLNEIKERIIDLANDLADDIWEKVSKERNELADILSKFPVEPFQPTIENITYWKDFILKTITLVEKLFPTGTTDEAIAEKITILYCATELSIEAIRAKVNVASAYAVAIGAGTVSSNSKPFEGPLTVQPPQFIKNTINTKLGRSAATNLAYIDLLEYLVDDIIIDNVLGKIPELKAFIEIFKEDFNDSEREILKLLLSSASGFIQNKNGIKAPKDTLRILVKSIDSFLTKKFKAEVLLEINKHITDVTLKTYLDEVFLTCVIYTKDVALNAALDWEKAPYTNDDFTEALAGVMMMFLGRTIVLMSDTLITATQNETLKICNDIADKIETNHKDIAVLKPILKDENAKQLIVQSLRVGGEVLGPLPDDTRKRVRMLLYQIFEVIKPGKEKDALEELRNQLFIPNLKDIEALTRELAGIAKYRFCLFAEKILLNIGKYILESLEELFLHLVGLVLEWEKKLAESLLIIAAELKTIDEKIVALNSAMIAQYSLLQTSYNDFIAKINSTQIKNLVKVELVNKFVTTAEVALKGNPIYKALPNNVKTTAINTMQTTIGAALDSPIMNPIFSCINTIGSELNDLMPTAKSFNAKGNLSEQFLKLVLDKIAEKIKRHFGSTNPSINVAFGFSYIIPAIIVTPAVHIPAKVITPAVRIPARVITPAVRIPARVITPAVITPAVNTPLGRIPAKVIVPAVISPAINTPAVMSPAINTPAIMSPAVNIPAVVTPAQTIRVHIPIGKVEIPLNLFLDMIRNAIIASDFYHTKLNDVVSNLGIVIAKNMEHAATELLKLNAKNRQILMNKISSDLTNKTPVITISKPIQFEKYNNDIPIEIQLKEVPASFLGLNTDEIQRVHILLNGKSIAPKSLATGAIKSNNPTELLIKLNAIQNDLVIGDNLLTVFIVGKAAKRFQQNVNFIYSPNTKPANATLQTIVTKQQMLQKVIIAKKYASDQNLLTFKNIK